MKISHCRYLLPFIMVLLLVCLLFTVRNATSGNLSRTRETSASLTQKKEEEDPNPVPTKSNRELVSYKDMVDSTLTLFDGEIGVLEISEELLEKLSPDQDVFIISKKDLIEQLDDSGLSSSSVIEIDSSSGEFKVNSSGVDITGNVRTLSKGMGKVVEFRGEIRSQGPDHLGEPIEAIFRSVGDLVYIFHRSGSQQGAFALFLGNE